MNIHFHHHYYDSEDEAKLDKILTVVLALFKQRGIDMSELQQAFADLRAKVANQTTVDQSVETLVQGLRDQLNLLAQQEQISPADVQAIADQIGAEQTSFIGSVTAGTPAAAPGAVLPKDAASTVQKPNSNVPVQVVPDPKAPENTPTTIPANPLQPSDPNYDPNWSPQPNS